MQPITPYLTVNGADKALEFYQQAFGATDIFRHPDKDGRLFHARMVINGGTVMMSDDYSKDHGGPPAPTPDTSCLRGSANCSIEQLCGQKG